VIVRTKDRPRLLAEALESLRAQTLRDFEVVLVNDGGPLPDDLARPAGLTVVPAAPARPGRSAALGAGLAASTGRYVAYLDDDDRYLPAHLETLATFLHGTDEYGLAYTDALLVTQTLGADGLYRETARAPYPAHDHDPDRLLYANHVPLICAMHRRDLAAAAGGFDEAFDLYEDWDFLIRLSALTRFRRLAAVTCEYRVRDDATNATTRAPWHGERAQAARRQVFAKHAARRSFDTEMALVDGFERDARELQDRTDAHLHEKDVRIGELELELRRVRADAARQAREAGEREAALAADRDAAWSLVRRMEASTVWRLFTPYWKLKERLKR